MQTSSVHRISLECLGRKIINIDNIKQTRTDVSAHKSQLTQLHKKLPQSTYECWSMNDHQIEIHLDAANAQNCLTKQSKKNSPASYASTRSLCKNSASTEE